MTEPTPESGTAEADAADARAAHMADRQPTARDERDAEKLALDPSVAEHYRDMTEKGAHLKGEGEIE